MTRKGKRAPDQPIKPFLLWFSLTDIWVLGLDPGGCHPGSKPTVTRMGDVRLAHLVPHLPDAPLVLCVRILQKIRVLENPGKNK